MLNGVRKCDVHTNRQTHKQNISTYRKNRPRGPILLKKLFSAFVLFNEVLLWIIAVQSPLSGSQVSGKCMEEFMQGPIHFYTSKLFRGALQFTSSTKLLLEFGWEKMSSHAKILGLTVFHKYIKFNLSTCKDLYINLKG